MPFLLKDWFCLKPGRENFKPHNQKDRGLLLCHTALISENILTSLERRFAGSEPVKMLLYGDYGVGKTHTIHHIAWWLEQNKTGFPAFPIDIQVGDISKSTRFDKILKLFLDKLGLNLLIELTHEYQRKKTGSVAQALEAAGVPSQVAAAVNRLLMATPNTAPPPIAQTAFDYLRGQRLNAAAASLGFGEQLTDSSDLFGVLLAVGEVYKEVRNERIIFIADEAARIEAVDADDAARSHWVNVNTKIFDDNNNTFGFIYTISGARRNLPVALFETQIQNRLGDNVFEIMNLGPADVEQFLKKLVEEFVDHTAVEALVTTGGISKADYDWNAYPFTSPAREEFIEYFKRTQEKSKPRDIADKLNDVAFIAGKQGKRLIDADCLRKAQM